MNLNLLNAYLGKLSLKPLMSTWALPRVPLTWSFILCRGSHSAVTQLRVIPSWEPSFLRSASVTWVDSLGANSCTPITGYLPWGISTFLSYHMRGFPLVVALSWVVSIPGFPAVAWVLHESGLPPTGTRTYGLEATFLYLVTVLDCRGYASSWRQLSWATSLLGDVSLGRRLTWRCLSWATSHLGDVSLCIVFDFDFWSTPRDGTTFILYIHLLLFHLHFFPRIMKLTQIWE